MGVVASDVLSQRCHPSCVEIGADSELRRRQQLLEIRKQSSVSHTLRAQRENQTAGAKISEQPFVIRLAAESKRFLVGQSSFSDLRAALTLNKEASEDAQGLEVAEARLKSRQNASPDEDLLQAAVRGDLQRLQRALTKGASLAKVNPRGMSALMLASSSSGKDAAGILQFLIEKSADISLRDSSGWCALHHACRNGKTDICKLLLGFSADPTVKTLENKTTLMLAVMEGQTDLVKELMKIKTVRDQLQERDALGVTALHFAVKEGNLDIARLLLEHHAKVHARDVDGKMPLTWACESGRLEVAKILVKRGAEVDGRDKSQRSAVYYACLNCYEGVALWLIKKNADPHHKDLLGLTASDVAEENGLGAFKRAIKVRNVDADGEFG